MTEVPSNSESFAIREKKRVYCFIDGFNLYHALDWYGGGETEEQNKRYRRYKWLSLRDLAQSLLEPDCEELVGVEYFTSVPTWDIGKQNRHRTFIKAQEAQGVVVTKGAFRDKEVVCGARCRSKFTVRVEKQTDVNIAVKLVDLAWRNAFDTALLMSGDTDLIPAIATVRSSFPNKQIVSILPIGKRVAATAVRQACNSERKMTEQHLQRSQLPALLVHPETGARIERPIEYMVLQRSIDDLAASED